MSLKALASALAIMILLPGCFGEDAEPASATLTTEPTATVPTENATLNTPPLANLTADLINGSAPLLVNFTINITDADGDNLTWTLDADGNGTTDANGTQDTTTANFTYAVEGVFNATLNVTDGTNTTTATISINVTAGFAEPVLIAEYKGSGTIGGAYALTNNPQYAVQCPGFILGQNGVGCVFLQLNKGPHDGLPGIVTTNANNFRMAFWDKCDAANGKGVGFGSGSTGGRVVIPAGTGCAVVWSSNTGDWGQTRSFTLSVYDQLPPLEETA